MTDLLLDKSQNIQFKINNNLKDYVITLLGYKDIASDSSKDINWYYWNRFLDVYKTIGYKCEWVNLSDLKRNQEKRLFITYNDPTSLELYQSNYVRKHDIIFQKLTSIGKGMDDINWTSNPKEWCKTWHFPIYKTIEYLYDLGLNIYGFGCKSTYDEFPEKKRICEKLKDRIHWMSSGGISFNFTQIQNAKPIMNNLTNDITSINNKWGVIGRGNHDAWDKYIKPLEKSKYNFNKEKETDINMIYNEKIIKLLENSTLCPIIHDPIWQTEQGIQDEFYSIFLSGRFGICDNLGAIDIFGDEIKDICTESLEEYYKKSIYYLEHPNEQKKYIEIIQSQIKERYNFYRQWENILNISFNINSSEISLYKEIRTPYFRLKETSDINELISLKYCYINELLLGDIKDIKYYYQYKLSKEFNIENNYSTYNNDFYLSIITSKPFIDKYHNKNNFDIKLLYNIINFHKLNNYDLIKKNDIRYNKVVKNYLYTDNSDDIKIDSNINIKPNDIILTFILIFKNRHQRALASIAQLVTKDSIGKYNFLIIEDESDDILDLTNFKYRKYVKHYIVKTNVSWTRSGLLNYGIKRCSTPFFLAWDCDFYFTTKTLTDITNYCEKNKQQNIVGIQLYDTDICDFCQCFNLSCTPYSNVWIYNTNIIKNVGMFSTDFIGWGLEERELEKRIYNKYKLAVVRTTLVEPVLHHSHNNLCRGINSSKNHVFYMSTINDKIEYIDNYIDYELIEYRVYDE